MIEDKKDAKELLEKLQEISQQIVTTVPEEKRNGLCGNFTAVVAYVVSMPWLKNSQLAALQKRRILADLSKEHRCRPYVIAVVQYEWLALALNVSIFFPSENKEVLIGCPRWVDGGAIGSEVLANVQQMLKLPSAGDTTTDAGAGSATTEEAETATGVTGTQAVLRGGRANRPCCYLA